MDQRATSLTRRDLLKVGGTALALGAAVGSGSPRPAMAQSGKPGGSFRPNMRRTRALHCTPRGGMRYIHHFAR
jgi:hypothetical protein